MRNLGMATVVLAGMINVDRMYYGGQLFQPAGAYLWRHIALWLV
jgi:hypothetical protein